VNLGVRFVGEAEPIAWAPDIKMTPLGAIGRGFGTAQND
jgi:hypothetical protein